MERLSRRTWPIFVSLAFFILGLAYIFGWGSSAEHIPTLWLSPQDYWTTFLDSSLLVHGHVSSIYQGNLKFIEFPGILIALAPLSILSGGFHTSAFKITKSGAVPAPDFSVHIRGLNVPFLNAQEIHFGTTSYVLQPQWIIYADPYALLLSCTALFACDALAERLQVARTRRAVLCVVEAFLLWNVAVLWGHPEDAVAVALAAYALIFALDGRFVGAGWLFGAALAFQPLVLLMLPVLLAMAGRRFALGLAVRSVLPAAVLLAVPLIVSFRATLHALIDQPSPPGVNHVTPWTALSPKLGGGLVAAGPIRLLGIALAAGLGVWAFRRWRDRPEILAWACVLALALRSYTESVMTPYYAWAALAVALVVAARGSLVRFDIAIALALAITITAQWRLAWFPWWAIQVVGLTALLVVTAQPQPLVLAKQRVEAGPGRSQKARRGQSGTGATRNNPPKGKGAQTVTAGRSAPSAKKKKTTRTPVDPRRSGRR